MERIQIALFKFYEHFGQKCVEPDPGFLLFSPDMDVGVQNNFRFYLRAELKRRTQLNSGYSLRAFAKSLGISPSGLSSVLSAKIPMSPLFVKKVGTRLKLSPEELRRYQLEAFNEGLAQEDEKQYEVIEHEKFEVIKEWYHYAILNLMRTRGFKPSALWISRRLGVSLGEVQSAIERLQAVGLLKVEKGIWKDLSSQFTTHTNNKKFNEACRINQVQLFEKALAAIENVAFENRNHTGVTIAFRKSDLDKAKNMIAKFRRDFMLLFDQKVQADEVYHISIALFPLSHSKHERKRG